MPILIPIVCTIQSQELSFQSVFQPLIQNESQLGYVMDRHKLPSHKTVM